MSKGRVIEGGGVYRRLRRCWFPDALIVMEERGCERIGHATRNRACDWAVRRYCVVRADLEGLNRCRRSRGISCTIQAVRRRKEFDHDLELLSGDWGGLGQV